MNHPLRSFAKRRFLRIETISLLPGQGKLSDFDIACRKKWYSVHGDMPREITATYRASGYIVIIEGYENFIPFTSMPLMMFNPWPLRGTFNRTSDRKTAMRNRMLWSIVIISTWRNGRRIERRVNHTIIFI